MNCDDVVYMMALKTLKLQTLLTSFARTVFYTRGSTTHHPGIHVDDMPLNDRITIAWHDSHAEILWIQESIFSIENVQLY
jgi:hypothetical protein